MKTYNRRQTLQLVGGALMATVVLPACSLVEKTTSYRPTTNRTEHFLQLSSLLTGQDIDKLDKHLALEFMQRLDRRSGQQSPGALNRLLAQFGELQATATHQTQLVSLVDEQIWRPQHCTHQCGDNKTLQCCLARDILLLWYAGFLVEKSNNTVPPVQFVYGSAESFRGALAWQMAGTSPPATGGGGYAYWAEKP